ncbi:MAG: hypothetical protein MN733_14340, partial [Nitrososphaera sp.]|nr:hypothetical protein [Nitrososphaera sp.]
MDARTDKKLKLLGLYLIVSVVMNLWVNTSLTELLWYCDAAALILGIALWTKSSPLATMILVTAIPSQFLWIVDFFLQQLGVGLGRTEHLQGLKLSVYLLSVNLHAIVMPCALYGVWKL